MIEVLANLKDRNLIANEEFLRLIYRFFGESVDAEEMLSKAKGEIDITQGRDNNPPQVRLAPIQKSSHTLRHGFPRGKPRLSSKEGLPGPSLR